MGRLKKPQSSKNQIRSISVLPSQNRWLSQNPHFDLSKFVQIHIQEFIHLCYSLDDQTEMKGGHKNGKKTIK